MGPHPTDKANGVDEVVAMQSAPCPVSISGFGSGAHAKGTWVWRVGSALAAAVFLATAAVLEIPPANATTAAPSGHAAPLLSERDALLLDEIQRTALLYFIEHTDPVTGLTRDRAPNRLAASQAPSSIAATGFALTMWCIADARGWLPGGEALRRVNATLRFAMNGVEQVRGWFYHFIDMRTGRRFGGCEVSTIDTALFLQGALFAREYLRDPETTRLVNAIYERIDWTWAQNGERTLSMGWTPEGGFLTYRWDNFSEHLGMYLLGLGSPGRPLVREAWDAWQRGPMVTLHGRTFMHCSPLFTHQYPHAWFDLRGVRDGYADYWQNSVDATLAQRDWSAAQTDRYPHWSGDLWGLTASDGPKGYMAWGTPGPGEDESDGTLVPCAPGGSLPFAPQECLAALHAMRLVGGEKLWGRYGFADAFNPHTGWVASDVIGIDVGIMAVMAENLRSELVWQHFMRAPEVRRALRVAGFSGQGPPQVAGALIAAAE